MVIKSKEKNQPKIRADLLLFNQGKAESRTQASSLIMAGKAYANGQKIEKTGQLLSIDTDIEVRQQLHPYVSRGGLKLARGLEYFQINPQGQIALDLGASTGGFTDLLLQQGAAKVFAVDVGYGQLAWKLRQDERVVVLERVNARYLTNEIITEAPDLLVCDASFISLCTILPASLELVKNGGMAVCLIKPQFEAGPEHVGKGGIVRDPLIHQQVCEKISQFFQQQQWQVQAITDSPIFGADGNKEFLIAAQKIKNP
ncbi:MAG: TlyA family RNA methyltransferase [Alphaproteobacteria bacterium]